MQAGEAGGYNAVDAQAAEQFEAALNGIDSKERANPAASEKEADPSSEDRLATEEEIQSFANDIMVIGMRYCHIEPEKDY